MVKIISNNFPEKSKFNLSNFQWFDLRNAVISEPKQLDFILPGFKSGTVGSLVSPGGIGKTMLALQAAVAITSGSDILSFSNTDNKWKKTLGHVIFLTCEDSTDILNERFHTIGKLLTPSEKENLFKKLLVAPLIGKNVNLMTPDWHEWITNVTRNTRLVIIDTLRRFHNLDENNSNDMARLLSSLECLCHENSTTILFLHHISKTGALSGGEIQQASRGSSVLTDNVRFQANLVNMTEIQAKRLCIDKSLRPNFVRLLFSKVNYSNPISDQWFFRDHGGILKSITFQKNKYKIYKSINNKVLKKGHIDEQW